MAFGYYFSFNALHGGGFFRNLRIYTLNYLIRVMPAKREKSSKGVLVHTKTLFLFTWLRF